jgi:hypothetical protein
MRSVCKSIHAQMNSMVCYHSPFSPVPLYEYRLMARVSSSSHHALGLLYVPIYICSNVIRV